MERLNKLLAQCGIASRRKCDQLIKEGKVRVNGEIITNPASKFPENVTIEVAGVPFLAKEEFIYLMFYKPRGCLTTLHDPYGRKTIMAFLQGIPHRFFPVGRLDYESEGLLLLTNDGEMSHTLTHPRFQVEKEYLIFAAGKVSEEALRCLERGIMVKGVAYGIRAGKIREYRENDTVLEVTLCEGKKHEIRIMFDFLNHPVLRLIRTAMGPIHLDERLLPGRWRYLTEKELVLLRKYTKERRTP